MAAKDIAQEIKEPLENVIREVEDAHADISSIKGIIDSMHTVSQGANQPAIISNINELKEALKNIEGKINVTLVNTRALKGMVDMSTPNTTPDAPGATEDDNARRSIEDLLKILIATSGVVLTLLWGLTQRTPLITPHIFHIIRWASFILVIAMGSAFLSYQFSIARIHKNLKAAKMGSPRNEVSRHPTIAIPFMVAWISFLIGCSFLLWAMWNIKSRTLKSGYDLLIAIIG